MLARSPRLPLRLFLAFLAVATTVLGIGWLQQSQTSGELVGHAAKFAYFLEIVLADGGFPAWLPDYLTGHPAATQLSFALAFPIYLPGILIFGPVVGMKLVGLLLLASGGLAAFFLGRRLNGDGWTGFAVGVAYFLAPQVLLRLGWQEHMTIVVTYPLVPLAFWALLRVFERGTPFDSILFAAIFSATLLAWSKMGATLVIPLAIFSFWLFATRPESRANALRALIWIIPAVFVLGVLALLPLLRERAFMAVFELEPFDAWQAQYSIKTATSFIDRGGSLFRSLPAVFGIDRGAYYLGVLGLGSVIATIAIHWKSANRAVRPLQIFLTIFLVIFWISFGPRSVWSANSAFLASAMRLDDYLIPIHWLLFAAPLVAIWWLCRSAFRLPIIPFCIAALVYLFVPGFRLLEILPVYQDLRAPDSFFILNATVAWAVCVGIAVPDVLRRIHHFVPRLPLSLLAIIALVLAIWDSSVYARWFFRTDLSPTALANYHAVSAELAKGSGRVLPLSGRYFLLDLPLTAHRPLATEALNRYLMPRYASRLQVASRLSGPDLLAYMRLVGVTDVLLDKTDPSIPHTYKSWIRSILPVSYENEDFAILRRPNNLYPAFQATQTTLAPPDLAETSSALDFGTDGIITLTGNQAPAPSPKPAIFNPVAVGSPNSDTREIALDGTPGWIVLDEAWHPDWTATLDGESAEVHRGAGAFPAVHVTPENKALTFNFRPPSWYPLTLITSAAGWLAALTFLIAAPPRFRRQPLPPSPIENRKSKIENSLVLIPTYNEAPNIPSLLDKILAADPRLTILVIDDASPDGTGDRVRAHPAFGDRVHLLARSAKLGLGSAYRAGFQWAIDHGHDAILEIDADHSHDPADIPRLLATLEGGADAAVGSRYLGGTRVVNWPRHRLFLSTFATHYARALTGLPLTDATSGFKAIRTSALRSIPRDTLRADGYGFQIELHWLLWKSGHILKEIPITFTERRSGQTKMSFAIALEAALLIPRLAIRENPKNRA